MDKRDRMFILYMDEIRWAFETKCIEALENIVKTVPIQYEKGQLSVDHYIALMNCGRTYLRILKEGNGQ